MSFQKDASPSSKTRALFLAKEAEWHRITALNRRYGLSSMAADSNAEAYRVASETNKVPLTPFTDNVVLRDIAHIIETGFPLFDSVFDIPDFVESERQRELAEYASMIKADEDRRGAEKIAREEAEKRQKRQQLASELGLSAETLARLQQQ